VASACAYMVSEVLLSAPQLCREHYIQASASSRDFTWRMEKPAMISFDSVNGPSLIDVLPFFSKVMRAEFGFCYRPWLTSKL
jgi:hypothetical protein